jgi:hypothetical protein
MMATKFHMSARRTGARFALIAVLTTFGVAGTGMAAVPAAADSIGVTGCQSTYAVLTWTNGNRYSYRCSGRYPVSVRASNFSAGGWSGTLNINDQYVRYFCDWDNLPLNGITIKEVFLSATKASWCQ